MAEEDTMRIGKRCFVGNLAWRTSWQDLKVCQGSQARSIYSIGNRYLR